MLRKLKAETWQVTEDENALEDAEYVSLMFERVLFVCVFSPCKCVFARVNDFLLSAEKEEERISWSSDSDTIPSPSMVKRQKKANTPVVSSKVIRKNENFQQLHHNSGGKVFFHQIKVDLSE